MAEGEPGGGGERRAAAAALAALRAAVDQRHAELATVPGGGDDLARHLAELRRMEYVEEPRPVSPRRGLGGLIVLARKLVFHLFFKWHARAVLQQQNELNQALVALLAATVERERELRRELGRLAARIARLEAAGGPGSGEPEGTD
jgi:hypothetical protein